MLRASPLCACCRHYPGTATAGATSLLPPSHISLPRIGGRVGLCNDLFEDCSAFTRVTACTLAESPNVIRYIEGFSYFVTSITAPIASGWSEIAGWDSHPLRNAALSRRTPNQAFKCSVRASALEVLSYLTAKPKVAIEVNEVEPRTRD